MLTKVTGNKNIKYKIQNGTFITPFYSLIGTYSLETLGVIA